MSNAPDASVGQQDFIKGWPNPALLQRPELTKALAESYQDALQEIGSTLNYGTKEGGAWMKGHPMFLEALSGFLTKEYGKPCTVDTLMSTGGSSMSTDIIARVHTNYGDYAVTEAPTYYLAHQMFRERGLNLLEVPIESDGMDLEALEKLCLEQEGKIKVVYTVPVHHNPTGVTMSNEKREKLAALAKKFKFIVIADEAYQLLNFKPTGVLPLFYHDDPSDPRIFSVGTFSKLIGPGLKVGWIQAASSLLDPIASIGFINSGNNPVTFSSAALTKFISSGALKEHIDFVSKDLGRKCHLLATELKSAGLDVVEPSGGYFIWVKSKNGKTTGRTGKGMSLSKDAYSDYMRLCFAWLTDEQIIEGVKCLKE